MKREWFKTQKEYDRASLMHPKAQEVLVFTVEWLISKGHKAAYYITETVTTPDEDKKFNRVSDTHRTRRAFDVSTKGMSLELINDLMTALNKKFGPLGAISQGKPRLVIYHNSGYGWHFHVQLNRSFALPVIAQF